MAEDLATLGVIVDASGARRDIRLTREELIQLANTGKVTGDVMKRVIPGGGGSPPFVPPNVPPQINAVTEAILRMRTAAAQSVANAFGAQLAIQMDLAEKSAMKLQRGLEGVVAAQQRMQQAAAQSAAAVMATQIAARDPFQGAGFGGPQLGPELPASLERAGKAADGASPHFQRLRGAMTQLALSASGVPGPIGRVASVLGGFALGGGVTVAVLAGIAAITMAWEKYTEGLRRADATMKQVHAGQLQFTGPGGTGSLEAAIDIGRQREARLAKELEDIQSQRGQSFLHQGPIGLALNLMQQERATERLADERDFLAEATTRAAKAERDLAIAVTRSNEDLTRAARQKFDLTQQQGVAALAGVTRPWDPNADAAAVRGVELLRNAQQAVNAEVDARRKLTGENLTNTLAAIEAEKRLNDAIAEGNFVLSERLVRERQIADAKMDLARFAIGQVAGAAGPFGGLVQGVGSNLLAGNPFGAAVAGVTGLIDGLIGMGKAAAAQREQMRQLQRAHEDFIDAAKVELGLMSPLEQRLKGITRQYADERDRIEAQVAAYQKLIDGLRTSTVATTETAAALAYYQKLLDEARVSLGQVNDLEEKIAAQERQRVVDVNQEMQQDYQVRLLRALGRTEEADALDFALKQQREYADAVKAGADEVTKAALAEVQRVEKLNYAMGKIQTRIDELAKTIDGLETFRNSLLLSDTKSPTAQLAEAKRQYDEILTAAQGGDQGAAGRLPAAAQAFLDASRLVNASGPEFQADFKRVLDETNALIQQFSDAKTIEELQLAVLKEIRDGVQLMDTRPFDPNAPENQLPTSGRGSDAIVAAIAELTGEVRASIAVQQEGFKQTIDGLTGVEMAELEVAKETRNTGSAAVALAPTPL